MIDHNELMAMIPSESIRKYVVDTGYIFSDWSKAALLYHNRAIDYDTKDVFLRNIAENTGDEKLKKQILWYLDYTKKLLEQIRNNTARKYVYLLGDIAENDKKMLFFDYDIAYEYGKKAGVRFCIEKYRLITELPDENGTREDDDDYCEDSTVYFDEKGGIVYISDSVYMPEEDEDDYFGFLFYRVPNPFERGDVVKLVNTDMYGVVECSQEDWNEYAGEKPLRGLTRDYSDVQIRVAILDESGTFYHEHINPVNLEYYPVEFGDYDTLEGAKASLLCIAGEVYKAKSSIEDLYWLGERYKYYYERSKES